MALSLIVCTNNCGGRSSLSNGEPTIDGKIDDSSTGGAANGGLTGAGANSTGSRFGTGSVGGVGGGASSGGWGGIPLGGASSDSGGAGSGGAPDDSTGGAGGTVSCDPLFECRGLRAYWLISAAYSYVRGSERPFKPEVAHCVNYHEDDSIDHLDYLDLIQQWWEGCREIGPQAPAATCLLPGDLDGNGCFDLRDYAFIEGEAKNPLNAANSCADVNDDGFIDELDLGALLAAMPGLLCPDAILDPKIVLRENAGIAQACGSAVVGDISGGVEVNMSDLFAVLSHFGLAITDETECLDINRDKVIDLADALHVINLSPTLSAPQTICHDRLSGLEEFVAEHRQCTDDVDCETFYAGCSHIVDHCSRLLYLEKSTDAASLYQLTRDARTCFTWTGTCRQCDEPAPEAMCISGLCQPAAP